MDSLSRNDRTTPQDPRLSRRASAAPRARVHHRSTPGRPLGPRPERQSLYLGGLERRQLLTREDEVELARRIEAGEEALLDAVLGSPIALRELGILGDDLAARRILPRDV